MEKTQAKQQEKNANQKVQAKSNGIKVCVLFGMPSKDCAYNGICRIEPEGEIKGKRNPRMSFAKLFWNQNTELECAFSKASIQEETNKNIFGSGYFIIIESYNLPKFACHALGANKLVVQPGIYPVHENEDTIFTKISVLDLSE